ncbi:WD40 repeat-like protein [Rhodotorula kratochvilovae]
MASKGSLVQTSIVVPAPTTVRGHSTKLYATPDGRSIAYGAGRTAVLRPLESGAGEARLFAHAQNVTVVRPLSAYYAASGDAGGNVKVWDTTGNYSLKLEAKPLAKINDVAADGEGKRLVVVGEGRSGWGASFSLDTGSSIGEISGHSKAVNAIAMRPGRPFRAVTGSDDFSVCVLNGVPFKYALTSRRHTRFVHSVAYAPSGALFASAGSDGQVLLYDGTSGEDKGALVDESAESAHAKTVFAASFAQDGRTLATSAADGMVKLWDVESGKVVQRWGFDEGDEVASQQVGNTFAGDSLVSLSFSGNLNVLDPRSATPVRTLLGHQNPVTALAVAGPNYDTFLSGDSAGRVLATGAESAEVSALKGQGHKGLVVDVVQSQEGGGFVSAGYDDAVKALSKEEFSSASLPTASQPKALASAAPSSPALLLATTSSASLLSLSGTSLSSTSDLPLPASSASATLLAAALSPSGTYAALSTDDAKLHIFRSGAHARSIELRANATALAFGRDDVEERTIAVGLQTGKVPLYDYESGELVQSRWADIAARVTSLAWSPAGTRLAASSLDESVRVYDPRKPGSILSLKNLHRGGVNKVAWAGEDKLVSAGADGAIRVLEVKSA